MVMELLSRIHRANATTLVLVTHDPSTADYARRRIVMSDGMVESDSTTPPPAAR